MIQLQVLNKILQTGDPSLILLNNLTPDFFSDYREEFKFILDHYSKFDVIPDKETFIQKFNDFSFIEVNEPDSYLVEELYNDKNRRDLAVVFNQMRSLLMNNDINKATKLFKEASDKMSEAVHLDSVDIFKDTSRFNDYVERTQDFNKYYVTTGFKELDDIFGGWDKCDELVTIIARTNQGKCLAKGTKVLMADGSYKKIEDVTVGDKVQSNGIVNTVLATHSGTSSGWRIIPTRYGGGSPFVVSSNHILTLDKYNTNSKKYEGLVDITVEDFLDLPKSERDSYRLYRPRIDYEEKCLPIPPYILGTWLGDGDTSRVQMTSFDQEITEEWEKYAASFGLVLSSRGEGAFEITRGYRSQQKNEIYEKFKNLGVLNNKHIPLIYLTSSRKQRLELLAGLIDTDGYYCPKVMGEAFEITQKSTKLADNIRQLCSSLGFSVTSSIINTKYNKKVYGPYVSLKIKGDTFEVPVKLSRKKSKPRNKWHAPNTMYSNFSIEPVSTVEYFGFECDGDHRFILEDGTLTHNSWILLKMALAAAEQGLKVGVYSGEMSVRKVGYRLDTLYGHISNSSMIHGNMNILTEYERYIDKIRKNGLKGTIKVLTPDMISGPAGVTALKAFIKKEKLDMLCIDQHSLLEDDRNARNPIEKAANISRDLKNLQVMERIPILAVSQQNRNSTEDGVDTTHIAQSDRIGQDSTIILAFHQDGKLLTMQIIKSRDSAVGKKLQYAIDLDKGIFQYVPAGNDATGGQGASELKNEFCDDGDEVY